MARVRIHFAKSGYACFISHVDMPMIFARAARRAGLVPELTQGFSPRARLALCPPLPVGVVGANEPADFWFAEWGRDSLERWNAFLPRGMYITDAREVMGSDAPSLNKLCSAASYLFEPLRGADPAAIADFIESDLRGEGAFLAASVTDASVSVVSSDLERCGPSFMVKRLVERGVISGWNSLAITRTAVGRWNAETGRVISLTEG
ncbi:MAG: TIGR03936 family radical SAM-associated protein [Synergistaceae bacterium]|jgi:hypothetical protein|nr:TIGR03936 family radical SAM-associated protein [Synergistaceae bacterium]